MHDQRNIKYSNIYKRDIMRFVRKDEVILILIATLM
jgi:hypothetical protein